MSPSGYGKVVIPMAALDDEQGGTDDDFVDMLDKVSLKHFHAKPTAILPFGASVLSWSVSAPAAVRVKLNGLSVAKTGEQVVQPAATTSYRLSAHAGQASRTLGTVQVAVDQANCETWELNNPRSTIEAPIKAAINNDDELYFSSILGLPSLIVSFSPGRIRLRLRLKKSLDYFPNPSISIDASFGLTVRHGKLEPIGEQISFSISVPWYAWGYPGAVPALAIAMDMARESGTKKMHETIQNLAQLLTAVTFPPPGKHLSAVRIDAGNNGAGVIEVTGCSNDLLKRLADISHVIVLE